MTPVALPELPEPYGWLHDARGNDLLTFVRVMPELLKLCTSSMPVYSHAQIQAAVLAERAAERARCAAICAQAVAENAYNLQTNPGIIETAIFKGALKQADKLAAAIRNQP